MAKTALPSDATLMDVESNTKARIEFVRVVLKSMDVCKQQIGREVFVRIGITGEGKAPNYWLTYDDEGGQEQSFGTYQGSVRALGYLTPIAPEAYSTRRISIFDVRKGLKALRDAKSA